MKSVKPTGVQVPPCWQGLGLHGFGGARPGGERPTGAVGLTGRPGDKPIGSVGLGVTGRLGDSPIGGFSVEVVTMKSNINNEKSSGKENERTSKENTRV